MKQLITGVAVLLLISVFLIQSVANQGTHSDVLYCETQVESFAEQIKQDGYITASNKANLQANISAQVGCEPGQVIITGYDVQPLLRGTIIEYTVTYPVSGVIGSSNFWGISDDENVATKKIEGKVSSEYVSWD